MLADFGRKISKVGDGNGDVSLLRSRFFSCHATGALPDIPKIGCEGDYGDVGYHLKTEAYHLE